MDQVNYTNVKGEPTVATNKMNYIITVELNLGSKKADIEKLAERISKYRGVERVTITGSYFPNRIIVDANAGNWRGIRGLIGKIAQDDLVKDVTQELKLSTHVHQKKPRKSKG